MLTSGSTVVYGEGNFTAASHTLFKVGVLTGTNNFAVFGVWLVTTPTGYNEMAVASTVTLQFFNASLHLQMVW
jgi:hypothetical protein